MADRPETENRRLMDTVACLVLPLLALLPLSATAADKPEKSGAAKTLSGISIVGNNEAPKSLFIVPWKASEIGSDSGLRSSLVNDAMKPVDKEVFMREIDFYEISTSK